MLTFIISSEAALSGRKPPVLMPMLNMKIIYVNPQYQLSLKSLRSRCYE
jgi:hypothetical protein